MPKASANKLQITGFGLILMSIVAGVVSSVWPEIIRPHLYWVLSVAVVGILMSALPWLPVFRESLPEEASYTSNIGGDNSGNQVISHGGTVVIGSSPAPPLIPTVKQEEEKDLPQLRMSAPAGVFLIEDGGVEWRQDKHGELFSVVWIENPHAPVGRRSTPARSVASSLTLTSSNGISAYVERAYWLDYQTNEINIGVGEKRGLLLGRLVGNRWHYYVNQRTAPLQQNYEGINIVPIIAPHTDLPVMDHLDITVTVFSTYNNFTIAEYTYRVNANADSSWSIVGQRSGKRISDD